MDFKIIRTQRLTLIPATPDLFLFEQNHDVFPECIKEVTIPDNWPPEAMSEDVISLFLNLARENKLYTYYWISEEMSGKRILSGSGGFIDLENGEYELGYSVLEQFQNRGYATEAVKAMTEWFCGHDFKKRIIAKTGSENTPSIRVLEKNGFKQSDFDNENDLWVYLYKY
ncbi:GNAT family N-acetyltransferase [Methanoplanus sp. FWC-SCC4]|uniref:GNAT family N-acetyltransferase n=1 Tax=Methanochimaera problematica TaxID=2609417 RepID=A0AA97FDA8_9EURY|nr:GNAT family N-acetyltransferase [Methanoplanus sp. FWC-SCC4]WOF16129.1 GNAT family N-acetyltransferase [Methanoplanus sp. FWC-SCC4]